MSYNAIVVPGAPGIPGLNFRPFRSGEYTAMAELQMRAHEADGIESIAAAEQWRIIYEHASDFDPQTDTLFAEVYGALVAFGRVRRREQSDGVRRFDAAGFVDPCWRRRGLGRAMLRWFERRAAAIDASLPTAPAGALLALQCEEGEYGKRALLQTEGFTPLRSETHLRRSLAEPIPDAPLPVGFEFRSAQPEHYRAIWEAADEAFQDHWGYTPGTEDDYRSWLAEPDFCSDHWCVVWHSASNRVAALVLADVLDAENVRFGRRRGYTEGISTRREFRRMGLARAALCESMRRFRALGFEETYHGVDSQNLSGANRVYEWCGYRFARRETTYGKVLV